MTDVFAYYFPQFYKTEENSEWWGEGFTDWQLVKNACPLFSKHNQPREPLLGFLDQSQHETIVKQVHLANQYCITGFNFYHYWFNGKVYLEKPAEILLADKSLDIKIMFTWANESWTRQWIGKPNQFLIKQKYYRNNGDIEKHYRYLSPFFKDSRYYKIDNKPVLSIYRPELIPNINGVISKLTELAISDGFLGIYFLACRSYQLADAEKYYYKFNGIINFNPRYSINTTLKNNRFKFIESFARKFPESVQSILSSLLHKNNKNTVYSYGSYIDSMVSAADFDNHKPVYHSVFPDWDNTARYRDRSTFFSDVSANAYSKALKISFNKLSKRHVDIMFINAWNEWSEGAYLEPDKKVNYNLLEETKKIREFI